MVIPSFFLLKFRRKQKKKNNSCNLDVIKMVSPHKMFALRANRCDIAASVFQTVE